MNAFIYAFWSHFHFLLTSVFLWICYFHSFHNLHFNTEGNVGTGKNVRGASRIMNEESWSQDSRSRLRFSIYSLPNMKSYLRSGRAVSLVSLRRKNRATSLLHSRTTKADAPLLTSEDVSFSTLFFHDSSLSLRRFDSWLPRWNPKNSRLFRNLLMNWRGCSDNVLSSRTM